MPDKIEFKVKAKHDILKGQSGKQASDKSENLLKRGSFFLWDGYDQKRGQRSASIVEACTVEYRPVSRDTGKPDVAKAIQLTCTIEATLYEDKEEGRSWYEDVFLSASYSNNRIERGQMQISVTGVVGKYVTEVKKGCSMDGFFQITCDGKKAGYVPTSGMCTFSLNDGKGSIKVTKKP